MKTGYIPNYVPIEKSHRQKERDIIQCGQGLRYVGGHSGTVPQKKRQPCSAVAVLDCRISSACQFRDAGALEGSFLLRILLCLVEILTFLQV